jgi:TPP-dependent indolepyruvate ferredoxin oxidoreductase alpha subunit
VALPLATPTPLVRAAVAGRPAVDPTCAGCAQLGAFRALRRADVAVDGRSGCDRDGDRPIVSPMGRWAAVTSAHRVRVAGARSILADAWGAGARVVVLADRDSLEARHALHALSAAGARTVELDLADLAGAEATARAAAADGGAVLVALSPCVRGAPRARPLAVRPARCNRCGACLSLGCPAISDPAGEAMAVDPAVCTGCARCAPLCRGRAIGEIAPPR